MLLIVFSGAGFFHGKVQTPTRDVNRFAPVHATVAAPNAFGLCQSPTSMPFRTGIFTVEPSS